MAHRIEVLLWVDATQDAVASRAAQYLHDRIHESISARGRARVAVSGGNTPRRTFQLLSQSPFRESIPWQNVEIYWVDERCVPPDDSDSNYGMTEKALLGKVPIPPSQIFRIRGELDPEEAAAKYESAVRQSFRLEGAELPIFDVVGLGMGPDGHTAALFPHSQALNEILRIAVANHVQQKDAWRVTLTAPVLNQARNLFFLIEGEDKAAVLKRVLVGSYNPEELPSQLIRPRTRQITMFLDSAAASLLPHAEGNPARLEIER